VRLSPCLTVACVQPMMCPRPVVVRFSFRPPVPGPICRMSILNRSAREIMAKIVYYGPGLCGKTTNLEQIHDRVAPATRGKLISLATEKERTLFFDFMPVSAGKIRGYDLKFQLYTVPGQVYYNASRKMVLQNADGIVFVADSHPDRLDANIESLQNLYQNLASLGIDLDTMPFVFQYNKRDTPGALPTDVLQQALNYEDLPAIEAVARNGEGVFETLGGVMALVEQQLRV
jgi:signal recognition particle receptor subunit beta